MPRIDIHHHHSPPEFARTIDRLKTNQQPLVDWTVSQSLDDMDKAGIDIAVTSPPLRNAQLGVARNAKCFALPCGARARLATCRQKGVRSR